MVRNQRTAVVVRNKGLGQWYRARTTAVVRNEGLQRWYGTKDYGGYGTRTTDLSEGSYVYQKDLQFTRINVEAHFFAFVGGIN